MELQFISKEKIGLFIDNIEGEIFLPDKTMDSFSWQRYPCDFSLEGFRTYLSPKSFFYGPREALKEKQIVKRTVVGIKACDLKGILFLRKVFKEGDFVDPFFRDDIFVISSDCTYTHENCFCSLLGDTPYPEQGFDLNLSEVEDGFIVEIGSERGKESVEKERQLFSAADSTRIEQRRLIREKVSKQMEGTRIRIENGEVALDRVSDDISKCVSCAACTNVCPSCFCFLLGEGSGFDKVRSWDSCQYPGYARVAGGANPRKEVTSRFAHRVECKFVYSPERFGSRGCFGCGRCIDACMGGIDFKDVLLKLSSAQFVVGSSQPEADEPLAQEFVDTDHKL